MRVIVSVLILATALLILPVCGGGGGGGVTPNPFVLSAVTPDLGREMGGTTIALLGAGFENAGPNTVTVGGIAATDVVALDDNHLTCVTDPMQPGLLDVAVTNDRGTVTLPAGFTCTSDWPNAEVRINKDLSLGRQLSAPVLRTQGQTVYAVWQASLSGQSDIYFNRSLDGGATWANADLRLNSGALGAYRSLNPAMCNAGASLYVVWFDERNGHYDIYFNRSLDGGLTWLASDVRLDTDTAGDADSADPVICCDGLQVYVAWMDRRRSQEEIYFQRSLDGGLTWLASDVRINTDNLAGGSRDAQIRCAGARVFLSWQDRRDGEGDIYFSRSIDAGATWLASDVRLDTTTAGSSNSFSSRMVQAGDDIYVAWSDRRDAGLQYESAIYLNRSTDAGVTWLAADQRIDDTLPAGSVDADGVALAVEGANLYVVWYDDRNDPGGDEKDIYFNRSADRGVTWQAVATRLDRSPPGARGSFYPQICFDAGHLIAVWEDQRSADVGTTLYANWSTDGGATWRVDDFRLDTRAPLSGNSGERWSMACDQGSIYVAWADDRSGDSDVWVRTSHP